MDGSICSHTFAVRIYILTPAVRRLVKELGIDPQQISRAVLSTTLATNRIVQKQIPEVGMIVSAGPDRLFDIGFTDSEGETSALLDLLEETRLDYIQLRNLNMDPEWYIESIGSETGLYFHGVRKWLATLRTEFPHLNFGYFNPYLAN